MELYRQFDLLLFDVKSLPPHQKLNAQELLTKLFWLRQQSLTDLDRRAKEQDLNSCWHQVEHLFSLTNFKEKIKRSDDFWNPIYEFTSYGRFTPKREAVLKTPKKVSRFLNATVGEMLMHLKEEASGIGGAPQDRLRLRKFIEELIEEAKLPKDKRDQSKIIKGWRAHHPLIEKYKCINDFKEEPMKSRLLGFLSGRGKSDLKT